LAFCTASIDNARMAFAKSVRVAIVIPILLVE
jgi:hypothetical protein